MGIGNLGVSELLVVALLVLLLFGPRRLPEIGRTVGKALREFKRGMNEVKRELDQMDPGAPSGDDRDTPGRGAPRGRLEPLRGEAAPGGETEEEAEASPAGEEEPSPADEPPGPEEAAADRDSGRGEASPPEEAPDRGPGDAGGGSGG